MSLGDTVRPETLAAAIAAVQVYLDEEDQALRRRSKRSTGTRKGATWQAPMDVGLRRRSSWLDRYWK